MFETLRKLLFLLSRQEKMYFLILICLSGSAALTETLGVASIFPYISILTAPDSNVSQRIFHFAALLTGESSQYQISLYIGLAVFFSIVAGTAFSGITTWLVLNFSLLRIHSMSQRILSSYLSNDYEFFIQRNSSTFLKNLLSEIGGIVGGVLTPLIQLCNRALLIIFTTVLLLMIDFTVAIVSLGVLISSYSIVYLSLRGTMSRMGSEAVTSNEARFHILTELFSGIREVKLWNKEQYYYQLFSTASSSFARSNSRSQLIALLPRYAIEIITFGGMVLGIIFLNSSGNVFAQYIPLLALYAAAGYKLLPSAQQIFANLSSIRYSSSSLKSIVDELGENICSRSIQRQIIASTHEIKLSKAITFENVTYRYPGTVMASIGPISLSIAAFSTTAIVGESGSGKSTIMDLVMGLLAPTSGRIFVDDQELDASSSRVWSHNVGYVPQNIYLTSGTIAENIAFGSSIDSIDYDSVVRAAQLSQIYDLIETLPLKFSTPVGENGVRLSGGQRQRIAIARAMYRNPEVLIFDEATSALDTSTEELVMQAISLLGHRKTIVIVTHRKNTLGYCDRVYTLCDGILIE